MHTACACLVVVATLIQAGVTRRCDHSNESMIIKSACEASRKFGVGTWLPYIWKRSTSWLCQTMLKKVDYITEVAESSVNLLKRPRVRRAADCGAAPAGHCCRETYYVKFRTLGWGDWIVEPTGYYANYCQGSCDAYLSNHAQIAEHAQSTEAKRLRHDTCCVPVRYSSLSMIYYGNGSDIIKQDIPDMVVEECGCM